jgi:thioredoxin 1
MIVTDDNFDEIIKCHKTIMIDFWAEWCRPCKLFSPIIEEVSKETGIWLGKMNVDNELTKQVEYSVTSIPTTILFKDGKPVKRITGAKPKHIMLEEIKEWI